MSDEYSIGNRFLCDTLTEDGYRRKLAHLRAGENDESVRSGASPEQPEQDRPSPRGMQPE